jgi:hypothetical protein
MILGIKSLVIALLGALSVGVPVATGALGAEPLGKLSVAACLLLGALTSLTVGMLGYGGGLWRPGSDGFDLRRGKLVSAASGSGAVRELPGWLLRLLLGASFLAIAASVLGNHGVVRLREELGGVRPPSGRCKPPEAAAAEQEEAEPEAPPPPPVDQAGCALVRRAYQLGYAKSLGTCAPQQPVVKQVAPKAKAVEAPCTRRQLDEPFLHYAWRRWAEAADWAAEVRPVDGSRQQAAEMRTKLGYFRSLTASSGHALNAVPHAAHHLWIALPDPEPAGVLARTLGAHDCEGRFVDVPLWKRFAAGEESKLVQHALGQLLFSSRFGTTTACANHQLHWGAAPDACDRLLADPEAFLREHGGWEAVAGVLDRRRRQLELRTLAQALGRAHLPPEPPPAAAVVSLSCLRVDGSLAKAEVTGKVAELAGQKLGVRQLRMPRIAVEGDGPLEVVAQLAKLLAGAPAASTAALDELEGMANADADSDADAEGDAAASGSAPAGQGSGAVTVAPSPPVAPAPPAVPPPAAAPLSPQQRIELLGGAGFSLARLEAIEGTDPFAGERWPLARADLVEVYPFQRVLFAFIDGFRRSYHAQRGRL